MRYIIYDTETTGVSKMYHKLHLPCSLKEQGSEVVQIGGLICDDTLTPIKAFCHYCDCLAADIPEDVKRVTGISMFEIRQYVPNIFLEDVLTSNLPEFFENDVIFCGYNEPFDMAMVSQSIRGLYPTFSTNGKIMFKIPNSGRWELDVLQYLPKRVKLVSFKKELTPVREEFHRQYAKSLDVFTNAPELFKEGWAHEHNALYDAIETYLLLKYKLLGKKILGGVR